MAVSTATTVDVAEALRGCLSGVDGLRVYEYAADTARPPCAVILQPEIDYLDNQSGFCTATWTFPVAIVVARNNDRDAQRDLSRLVSECAQALNTAEPDGIFAIEPVDARPTTVNVSGTDLAGYAMTVRVRA